MLTVGIPTTAVGIVGIVGIWLFIFGTENWDLVLENCVGSEKINVFKKGNWTII